MVRPFWSPVPQSQSVALIVAFSSTSAGRVSSTRIVAASSATLTVGVSTYSNVSPGCGLWLSVLVFVSPSTGTVPSSVVTDTSAISWKSVAEPVEAEKPNVMRGGSPAMTSPLVGSE